MPPIDLDARAAHRAAVEQARNGREARLRDPTGWLSLVGLHWLHPGDQQFGGDPTGEIVLHANEGEVAPIAGTISVIDGRVVLRPTDGAVLTVDGRPIADGTELVDDQADTPTTVELASLRLTLIHRGAGRLAVRVKDTAAPALQAFDGLAFFAIDPRWRVVGRLVPADPGATIAVPDIVGDVVSEPTPGVVEFTLDGRTHRLDALEAEPGHLWLIFSDETNGNETYAGGRFIVTGPVQPDGITEIDFNLAYNPPCVFSPYATCPLPPSRNRLGIRIEAGEKAWGGGHSAGADGRADHIGTVP